MDRLNDPRMEYYRYVYRNSTHWDGHAPLKNKTVIVYAEQGFGDIIMFSRYIPDLKARECKVYFHCPVELHRLFRCFDVELLDKDNPTLPEHDYHILSLEFPFLLFGDVSNFPEGSFPYITINEFEDLSQFGDKTKIGIAWEGGPLHEQTQMRNCHLEYFKILRRSNTAFFMLQKETYDQDLIENADELDLYGSELTDFYDTAKLINALDVIVSVDTSVIHLAGAMKKKGLVLLNQDHDHRWDVRTWYPTITCVTAKKPDDWESVFKMARGLL